VLKLISFSEQARCKWLRQAPVTPSKPPSPRRWPGPHSKKLELIAQMQINPSRIRNVRDKLEEALEEVERLLEELEASRPPPEPPPRPTKVTRSRRTTRRISP
jgi:hypothetical protein